MVIAVDFDGTCVTHEYPKIGKDIGAIPVLQKLIRKGHKLILYTMRGDNELRDAIEYLEKYGVMLYAVNRNPTQSSWTSSPKIYANLYIDDASLGIPLLFDEVSGRNYVDWIKVEELLNKMNIL